MDVVAKIKCVMQLTVTSISVPLVLQSGKTPLHVAAEYDHVDVVTKLLEGCADLNVEDEVSTLYPGKWCSLTSFIEILFLLGVEFFWEELCVTCTTYICIKVSYFKEDTLNELRIESLFSELPVVSCDFKRFEPLEEQSKSASLLLAPC